MVLHGQSFGTTTKTIDIRVSVEVLPLSPTTIERPIITLQFTSAEFLKENDETQLSLIVNLKPFGDDVHTVRDESGLQ